MENKSTLKGAILRYFAAFLGIWCCILSIPCSAKTSNAYRFSKTADKKIALTFDDGPHPSQTKRILDILDAHGVKATFFMVGVNVQNYPDVAREVVSRGHEIGNHTFSHSKLGSMSESDVSDELERCEASLQKICNYHPQLFRPPQGALSNAIEGCSFERDYRLILWSLDTRDWEVKNTQQIVKTVLSKVKGGDIILMHDYVGTHSKTADALEILLPELLSRGYEPVTVSELLANE